MSFVRTLLSGLRRYFASTPKVDIEELCVRQAWTAAASELGLAYSVGARLCDDEMTGIIDGYRICIRNQSNFDIQRHVTVVTLSTEHALGNFEGLQAEQLLAAYDHSVKAVGAVPGPSLSDEDRAWFLGHRLGGGLEAVGGDLLFRTAFYFEDDQDIVLVARALVVMARQLMRHCQSRRRGERWMPKLKVTQRPVLPTPLSLSADLQPGPSPAV